MKRQSEDKFLPQSVYNLVSSIHEGLDKEANPHLFCKQIIEKVTPNTIWLQI